MRLDKMLGIKYPFIQGGMANIATGEFAAAIINKIICFIDKNVCTSLEKFSGYWVSVQN